MSFKDQPWKAKVGLVKQALDVELRQALGPLSTRTIAADIAKRLDASPSEVSKILMKLAPGTSEAFKGPEPFVAYGKAIYPWLWGPRTAVQTDEWTIEPEPAFVPHADWADAWGLLRPVLERKPTIGVVLELYAVVDDIEKLTET